MIIKSYILKGSEKLTRQIEIRQHAEVGFRLKVKDGLIACSLSSLAF